MAEFKTLALVLRGQNAEGELDKIYDREKLTFRATLAEECDDLPFETAPHVVFVTHKDTKAPLIDFILGTRYVKLFHDPRQTFGHLANSVAYHDGSSDANRDAQNVAEIT